MGDRSDARGGLVEVATLRAAARVLGIGVIIALVLRGAPATAQNAYVANFSSNTVSVIATATNTVVSVPGACTPAICVGYQPTALAVSPDGSTVYVANEQTNNVSVIDAPTNTVTATILIGAPAQPHGMAVTPDGTRVYVANWYSNNVSVITTATKMVTDTISVGTAGGGVGPVGVAVTPDGSTVYVANYGFNNVWVISTATNTVVSVPGACAPAICVGAGPMGVAVTPNGSTVYVANWFSNNVSVIDRATNTATATISVGNNPNGVAVTPDGRKVYVGNSDSNNVSVIDTATNIVTYTISLGPSPVNEYGPSAVAVAPDGSTVYVASLGDGVSVIATASNMVAATVSVGSGPNTIGIQPVVPPACRSGVVHEFSLQTKYSYPSGITAGPDGNIWFTEGGTGAGGSKLGRITPQAAITEFYPHAGQWTHGDRARPRRESLVYRGLRQQDRKNCGERAHGGVSPSDCRSGCPAHR